MSRRSLPLLALPFLVACSATASWEAKETEALAVEPSQAPSKGIVTLWARDPELREVSFADGLPGDLIEGGMVYNRQGDLDYDNYTERAFTVGIEGSISGVILDLGTPDELQERYGYEETVGGGQGFASIQLVDGAPRILADYQAQTLQPLEGTEELFVEDRHRRRPDGSMLDEAPVHVDHVYLLRLWEGGEPDFERIVKLLVLDHEPGRSVTLRWVRIAG